MKDNVRRSWLTRRENICAAFPGREMNLDPRRSMEKYSQQGDQSPITHKRELVVVKLA